MSEDIGSAKTPLPPYIAFKTLTDLIERMEREDPPTRVDPSYLDSYAGGYRPTVISNLQTLGLLLKSGEPTEQLLALVKASEAERQQLVAEMVKHFYADILALGRNSTQGQFLEAFAEKGVRGDTRRKAIGFMLKACKYGDVAVSPHWKTPPASTSGSGASRRKPPAEPKSAEENGSNDGGGKTRAGSGETVDIDLGSAGSVVVHVNVAWLALDDKVVAALREGIKKLQSLPRLVKEAEAAESEDSDDDIDYEESDV